MAIATLSDDSTPVGGNGTELLHRCTRDEPCERYCYYYEEEEARGR